MPGVKSPVIIAVVGMAGSGKSLACEFLGKKGYPVLRFGDQTDIGLKEQGLALTESNERRYREKLRRELGMAAYAIKIEPRLKTELHYHPGVVILDGLYSWEEYIYLKPKFPELKLLAIYAPPALRVKRLAVRRVRPLTQVKTQERDIVEIENSHKAGPIALADYLVINDGSVADFYHSLDKALINLQ